MPKVNRTTTQMSWTIPIELVPRFLAIVKRKMMKPSHVITQLILKWVEENE